jgi:diguanylate cyclase (GGDEF)-like protein
MSHGRINGVILCVDDDATILSSLKQLLNGHFGKQWLVECAESGEDALDAIESFANDGIELSVIISDYIMPGMNGDELLAQVHRLSPETVKVMLTGQSHLAGIVRAINEAQLYRYLEKPFDNTDFVLTIEGACKAYQQERMLALKNSELLRINSELEGFNKRLEAIVAERTQDLLEKNAELELLSVTDKLTGLFNRQKLDKALIEEVARSERYYSDFSVILLDVDLFKQVNDTHGHEVGDTVLVEISKILSAHVRLTDLVGRWGGEEFLIVCCGSPLEAALSVAEKLREVIAAHVFSVVGHKTASFGVAQYRADDDVKSIVASADRALYQAKNSGRNRVCAALGLSCLNNAVSVEHEDKSGLMEFATGSQQNEQG